MHLLLYLLMLHIQTFHGRCWSCDDVRAFLPVSTAATTKVKLLKQCDSVGLIDNLLVWAPLATQVLGFDLCTRDRLQGSEAVTVWSGS